MPPAHPDRGPPSAGHGANNGPGRHENTTSAQPDLAALDAAVRMATADADGAGDAVTLVERVSTGDQRAGIPAGPWFAGPVPTVTSSSGGR